MLNMQHLQTCLLPGIYHVQWVDLFAFQLPKIHQCVIKHAHFQSSLSCCLYQSFLVTLVRALCVFRSLAFTPLSIIFMQRESLYFSNGMQQWLQRGVETRGTADASLQKKRKCWSNSAGQTAPLESWHLGSGPFFRLILQVGGKAEIRDGDGARSGKHNRTCKHSTLQTI